MLQLHIYILQQVLKIGAELKSVNVVDLKSTHGYDIVTWLVEELTTNINYEIIKEIQKQHRKEKTKNILDKIQQIKRKEQFYDFEIIGVENITKFRANKNKK